MKDPESGRMIRAGGQKAMIAAFAHETSRNLDPQFHTHAVIANMVQDADGKWRTVANEKLYRSKMPIGALYRRELAREVVSLGYSIEKTHADGRFEIRGVPREVIEAFSTRRAGIEAAMAGRGPGMPADNLAGAAAARWLKLSAPERGNIGLMAPSHVLRREINDHIRERLARENVIRCPAFEGERLVPQGYTNAEKAVAANYAPGDVVAFHRDYKSLGVAKGDERRVASVDGAKGTVMLEGPEGQTVAWRPRLVGAKRGGVEIYRAEAIELRVGDRIRWTRKMPAWGW